MANTHSLDLESGSSQSASASSIAAYAPSSYTIEMWIKAESYASSGAGARWLLTKDDESSNRQFAFAVKDIDSRKLYLEHYGNGAEQHIVQTTEDNVYTTGTWVHVAVVNNAGTFIFYVNGVAQTTTVSVNNYVAQGIKSVNLDLGKRGSGGYFDGLIDDVRFWNTARSAGQILANYQTELVGNESGLIGYWKLNNGYTDETSNANSFSPSNTPVFSTDVPFSASASASASASLSPSASQSPSASLSPSASASASASKSQSPSASLSPSASSSPSTSSSVSSSVSMSISPSSSPSVSASASPSLAVYVNKYSTTGNTYVPKYNEFD